MLFAMIFRHEYRGGVWVDIERPSDNEIRQIAREFSIGERFERELFSSTPLPLVTGDETMALMVLHFPTTGSEEGETKSQEVDFVVGKHFIVTVRYEIVTPLHHLKKLLETQELVEGKAQITTDVLLEVLFAHLYTAMRDHTNIIAENLARVEKKMFSGKERMTVRAISNISRSFLHIESALANQEESIGHFLEILLQRNFFGPTFADRSGRILAETTHISRIVKTHRAAATELRETNIALLEARQNEIMKTLTTMTVIVLPLELIAFIFGMHLPGTPLYNDPNAFGLIMIYMLISVVITTLYFAWKRWIF